MKKTVTYILLILIFIVVGLPLILFGLYFIFNYDGYIVDNCEKKLPASSQRISKGGYYYVHKNGTDIVYYDHGIAISPDKCPTLEGATAANFSYLNTSTSSDVRRGFGYTSQYVYCEDKICLDSNLQGIQALSESIIKTDSNIFELQNGTFVSLPYDVGSYEVLSIYPHVTKDKNNVYFKHQVISEADSATYKIIEKYPIDGFFAVDKNSVFAEDQLTTLNPRTIVTVDKSPYITDGDEVYFGTKKILSSITGKFSVLENSDGQIGFDSNNFYIEGEVVRGITGFNFSSIQSNSNIRSAIISDGNQTVCFRRNYGSDAKSPYTVFTFMTEQFDFVKAKAIKSGYYFDGQQYLNYDCELSTSI